MAREVAQQGFRNLGIKIGLNAESQHGGSDCHVEQLDPEVHLSEGKAHIVGAADDVRGEFSGRGQLAAKLVTQQPLVEALHGSEQRQLPFGILSQSQLLRDRTGNVSKWDCLLVKPKGKRSAIGYPVTEVSALLPACRKRSFAPSPSGIKMPLQRY